jgi:hypothetical protein
VATVPESKLQLSFSVVLNIETLDCHPQIRASLVPAFVQKKERLIILESVLSYDFIVWKGWRWPPHTRLILGRV